MTMPLISEKKQQFLASPFFGSVCAAALGMTVAVLQGKSSPQLPKATTPVALQVPMRVLALLNQPICLLVFVSALAFSVSRRKFEGVSSLAAYFLIAGIVTHLIRVWVFH
jgi:hypothetical protein